MGFVADSVELAYYATSTIPQVRPITKELTGLEVHSIKMDTVAVDISDFIRYH